MQEIVSDQILFMNSYAKIVYFYYNEIFVEYLLLKSHASECICYECTLSIEHK